MRPRDGGRSRLIGAGGVGYVTNFVKVDSVATELVGGLALMGASARALTGGLARTVWVCGDTR